MKLSFQNIFELEEAGEFKKVFEIYSDLYSKYKSEYEIWKHFYFFLWLAIEDAPREFNEKINLRELMQKMFEEGKRNFSDLANFNFITGYTVSIFPYEYGDYDDLEIEAKKMLKKATEIDTENLIYKLVFLGSLQKVDKEEYKKTEIDAAPTVLEVFKGKGMLNKYFRQVLYRIDKKTSS
ncbi:hypothetical protein [Confluentibacter lentus]|uniref:hypothetical protein n=1 Tax=Confluentibacter lentus TaxID=1699412 RepID=UPI000C283B38|nr:hypothetical protein [Confluentibacter lentus]